MREQLFEDVADMPNVHDTISLGSLVDAQQTRESLEGKHVCPYCGALNDSPTGPCPNCSLENTPAGRKATKTRIGPWYVLQRRNPAAPGMKYEMLLNFVRKGRIKPRTVVRGPTTYQLWRFAAHVKGLSREFGLCYSCGGKIEPSTTVCPQCNRLQLPPLNPDALLESGDAESPPGAMPLPAGIVAGNGINGGAAKPTAAPEPPDPPVEPEEVVVNHDIVVPALADYPSAAPSAVATAAKFAAAAEIAPLIVPPPAAPPLPAASAEPAEITVAASAPLQSMALTTTAMPSIADAPVGARARSAALKAGMVGPATGPRIVPLGGASLSPTPVLPAHASKVPARYGAKGRWRGAAEMVLFLLVLVGALGGALLVVNSSLREQAESAYDRVLKATHLKSATDTPMPTVSPQPGNPGTARSAPSAVPSETPRLASENIKPRAARAPTAAPPRSPVPAPPPPETHSDSSVSVQNPPPARSDADPSDDTPNASDKARAKELYFAAIDAEGHADWATAVRDYKEILKLPKNVRYTDVERRLADDEVFLSQPPSH